MPCVMFFSFFVFSLFFIAGHIIAAFNVANLVVPAYCGTWAGGYGCSWQGCGCNCLWIRSHLAVEWSGQTSQVASLAGQGQAARWVKGKEETPPSTSSSPASSSCPSFFSSHLLSSFFSLRCTKGTSMNKEKNFLPSGGILYGHRA